MDSATHPYSSDFTLPATTSQDLVAAAAAVLEVESIRHLRVNNSGLIRHRLSPTLEIRGRLLMDSERAYEIVSERFRALEHVALLRKDRGAVVVLAVPGTLPAAAGSPWLAIGLFIATLVSVLWVGSESDPTASGVFGLISGLPFAVSLLGILLAHEFGHYLVAMRLGVPTSLPYFIPLPISLFGTMGALIQMKAPPTNKRGLFAVAIAGPLAGLVVAIPVLVIGLLLSPVQPLPVGAQYLQEGNSVLYAGLKYLLFGRFLPSGGEDVLLHPVALAGWAGLLVTGLNLIPAGQLDGGHVVYALFGRHARRFTYGVVMILLALSAFWQGWLLWAGLVFLFGRVQAAPLDDVTSLKPIERLLAVLVIAIFALIFSPIPMDIVVR